MAGGNESARFERFLDPADLWTIWDNATGEPALIDGQFAMGLSLSEAEAIMVELECVPEADEVIADPLCYGPHREVAWPLGR